MVATRRFLPFLILGLSPISLYAANYDVNKVTDALSKSNSEVKQMAQVPMQQLCKAHLNQSSQFINQAASLVKQKKEPKQINPFLQNAFNELNALGTTHKTYCWPVDNNAAPAKNYLNIAFNLVNQSA